MNHVLENRTISPDGYHCITVQDAARRGILHLVMFVSAAKERHENHICFYWHTPADCNRGSTAYLKVSYSQRQLSRLTAYKKEVDLLQVAQNAVAEEAPAA